MSAYQSNPTQPNPTQHDEDVSQTGSLANGTYILRSKTIAR